MLTSARKRTHLAQILARHLPSWEDRAAVASRAGLYDVQVSGLPQNAWRLLIDEAILQQRLPAVLKAASERAPSVPVLRRLAESAATGALRLPLSTAAKAVGGVAIGLLLLVGLTRLRPQPSVPETPDTQALAASSEAASPSPAASQPAAQAEVVPEPERPAPTPEPERPAPTPEPERPAPTPEPDTPPPAAKPQPVEQTPPPAAKPRATPAASPAASGSWHVLSADVPAGVCDGWTYAGTTFAYKAGDVWTAPQSMTIRVGYPDAHNHYALQPATGCTLKAGTRLRLGQEPARIPGGIWVFVSADALLP